MHQTTFRFDKDPSVGKRRLGLVLRILGRLSVSRHRRKSDAGACKVVCYAICVDKEKCRSKNTTLGNPCFH